MFQDLIFEVHTPVHTVCVCTECYSAIVRTHSHYANQEVTQVACGCGGDAGVDLGGVGWCR